MKRRRATQSVIANPVLVGAVTVLVVIVAVFLAYNANNGLPFVPTTQLDVEIENAAKLVRGNDVREGGKRIGIVDEILPTTSRGGDARALLRLKLDKSASPVPADTTVMIRPRSALGLKYVDLRRGDSSTNLPSGARIVAGESALPVELEDFFEMFDERTRVDIRKNLAEFGGAFAARGDDLNDTIGALPQVMEHLTPVAATLVEPSTQLPRFIDELEDGAATTAPVAEPFARGFTGAADTFEGLSRDERALRETIARSPATLDVATRSLRAQRPFLVRLAGISDEVSGTARALRRSLPPTNAALRAGVRVLPDAPALNRRLGAALRSLERLAEAPTTNLAVAQLENTVKSLNPTLRWLGPHVTVCNYWNYWWTFLSDHLSEVEGTGTLQRIQAKSGGIQDDGLNNFGAAEPAHGAGYVPTPFGAPAHLHAQPYGRAVNEQGEADCESGQRGYIRRAAVGLDPKYDVAVDPRTPGDQGPTYDRFNGRDRVGLGPSRVPEGQTFSAEPENGMDFTP